MPYLATKNGESQPKAKIIRDTLLHALVDELNTGFEATTEEWVQGFVQAIDGVLSPATKVGGRQARERMIELLQASFT